MGLRSRFAMGWEEKKIIHYCYRNDFLEMPPFFLQRSLYQKQPLKMVS
jgi:hypothetical protein